MNKKPNLWVLKSVHEDDKASQTDSYEDSLTEHYNYDNFVANSQQIVDDDFAILIDKENILGFARIDYINSSPGTKIIRRCPECPSTTIDKRKTKKPTYRCNKGHEFETPIKEVKPVKKYRANFGIFIPIATLNNNLKQLRLFYSNGYNQNMSMQRLNINALTLFENIEERLSAKSLAYPTLPPDQGYTREGEEPYLGNDYDEREVTFRAIKLRRGQQKFRDTLLKRYNNTCVITGCKIVDILEAAHIKPYRGKNDNHPSNGLLLRADIHTLFDLNLIGINPDTMTVHLHSRIKDEYIHIHNKNIKFIKENKPSQQSLLLKWKLLNL